MKALSLALAICAGLGAAPVVCAQGRISVSIGKTEFAGLEIEDLGIDWKPAAEDGGRLSIRAARVRGLAATGPLAGFSFDCPALRIDGDVIACPRGRLSGRFGTLGGQDTTFNARRTPDNTLSLHFDALAFAGGRAAVDARIRNLRWTADAIADDVDLEALVPIAKPWLELPEGFSVAGRATGRVKATGSGDELATADLDLAFAQLNFADAAGELAGEAVTGILKSRLTWQAGGAIAIDGRLELTGGQAYSAPVFLDLGAHRMDVDFKGPLSADGSVFRASEFRALHHGVGEITGSATLDLAGETLLRDGRLRFAGVDLTTALPGYLQPFLIDTAFKNLAGAGRMLGEVEIAGGLPTRAALSLEDVNLDSRNGALTVDGLAGELRWFDDAQRDALVGTIEDEAFHSRFSWRAATLWGLEIGAVELPFAYSGRHFRLLQPMLLPVFDGGLAIKTLRVRHAGNPEMYVRFDAEVRPISIAPLSRAFGWPEFSGKLAGSIPDLQLAQGVVTLGGNLEAAVFDGRVVVRDLRLREPLGKFPRMHASIDVENLDLKLVTDTFSFGSITGRLSGYIRDLETFAWMPASFEAGFATPPGDRSKHRISQRAVTNLSSIGGGSGGGVVAALQGGFLRFFDDFGYDRLGLNCRLENDVCAMSGVERTNGAYYIVKGSGLPRIDVIGSQSRVAWSTLVRQLAKMMESEIVVE